MSSQGQFLGTQTLHMVRLADDCDCVSADPRFGVIATDLPFDGWASCRKFCRICRRGA